MKTLKTTAITSLFVCVGMIALQGCGILGGGGSGGYGYSPPPYTSVTYHFDPKEYFSNQNYKSNRPFYMRGGNISSPLLNTKEGLQENKDRMRFYYSGALHSDGSDIHAAYSPGKKIMIMAGFSSSSENSAQEGFVYNVPVTTETVTYNSSGSYSTSTYQATKNLPYQMEHRQSQSDQEIAIGYNDFIGNHGVWESFAGYGNGVSQNTYSYQMGDQYTAMSSSNQFYSTFTENRNSYRLFLQNTIGYSTNVTEASLCVRVTYIHFTNQKIANSESITSYEFNPTAFLAEPVMHFGIGFRNFKLISEYAFAIPLSGSDVEWNKGNVKFGAVLKF